jgi:hypothetical protein
MKEILDFIDDIKFKFPEFEGISICVSDLLSNDNYFLIISCVHNETVKSFSVRKQFSKVKDALKYIEECKKEIIKKSNNVYFL